ncbi:MAG: DUF350 domain-containing protein [Candidatus Anstonellales archaeon]
MADLLVGLLFGFIKFVSSIVLAIASVYIGIKAFDRLTERVEEIEELKKGNTAVGILIASIILSIATVVSSGVAGFTEGISPNYDISLILLLSFINLVKLVFALLVAIVTIYFAFNFLDYITKDISEIEELKENNVAMAVFIGSVILSVSFVVNAGMSTLITTESLNSCSIAISFAEAGLPVDATGCYLTLGAKIPVARG